MKPDKISLVLSGFLDQKFAGHLKEVDQIERLTTLAEFIYPETVSGRFLGI